MIACLPKAILREKVIMCSKRLFADWRSNEPVAEYSMKSESINRSTYLRLSDSTTGRISSLAVVMVFADATIPWYHAFGSKRRFGPENDRPIPPLCGGRCDATDAALTTSEPRGVAFAIP